MKAARIADQIAQVDRDLTEIDEQVQLGELDDSTADRLRSAYRSERSSLEEQLASIEASASDSDAAAGEGVAPARTGPLQRDARSPEPPSWGRPSSPWR